VHHFSFSHVYHCYLSHSYSVSKEIGVEEHDGDLRF